MVSPSIRLDSTGLYNELHTHPKSVTCRTFFYKLLLRLKMVEHPLCIYKKVVKYLGKTMLRYLTCSLLYSKVIHSYLCCSGLGLGFTLKRDKIARKGQSCDRKKYKIIFEKYLHSQESRRVYPTFWPFNKSSRSEKRDDVRSKKSIFVLCVIL